MKEKQIKTILKELKNNADFIISKNDGSEYSLTEKERNPDTIFRLKFFTKKSTNQKFIRIKLFYGIVVDYSASLKCLHLNSGRLNKFGPLSTSLVVNKNKKCFLVFVGLLIFPQKTKDKDIARIIYNSTYVNYVYTDFKLPGVKPFFRKKISIANDEKKPNIIPEKKEEKPIVYYLKDVEAFNLPYIDNEIAQNFLRRADGDQAFVFDSIAKPKAIAFYDIRYNYPRLCSGHGYLYSITIDQFEAQVEHMTFEEIQENYCIGYLSIDYGGNLSKPKISTTVKTWGN